MDKKQIDRFFNTAKASLENTAKVKVKVIVTGAVAGILLGGNRPSIDIDFAIICAKRHLGAIEDALKKASEITGIAVNFSEDIDRWSQITFLDYKRHTVKYKTFGSLEVSILSPEYWSIGKMSRYLDPDVDDLVKVFKNKPPTPEGLAKLWGRALARSLRSSASFSFRMHVEHFFNTYGKSIWGEAFEPGKCLDIFRRTMRE